MFNPKMAEQSMIGAAKVWTLFAGDYEPCGDTPALECGYSDTTDRVKVACSDYTGSRTAVLMTVRAIQQRKRG